MNTEQYELLTESVIEWNEWRHKNPNVQIDLAYAELNGAELNGAFLNGAKLNSAELNGAKLNGADLIGAKLNSAKLNGAELNGAKLINADLGNAKLNGANLGGVDLTGANLTSANLTDAKLNGANIDFSVWPIWCGSLRVNIDERIAAQLAYHLVSVCQYSGIGCSNVMALAEKFHRAEACSTVKFD